MSAPEPQAAAASCVWETVDRSELQAGITAHDLDKRPERAREALETIERTSSRALEEMRTVLGVLRADGDARAPQPGLDQVSELTEKAREAGLDIEIEGSRLPHFRFPGPSAPRR